MSEAIMAYRVIDLRDIGAMGAAPPSGSVRAAARNALARLNLWRERARQRRQLLDLPPHLLRDVGIDRADALREAGKPFWRP